MKQSHKTQEIPMNWFAVNFVSTFLLPPLNLLLLGFAGIILLNRRPRLGKGLIIAAFALLYLLSTPLIADKLLGAFETSPPFFGNDQNAGAIVILGGGTYFNAPEYGGDTVKRLTLERLRYGARLYRRTGVPILVTGGSPAGGTPEGLLMRDALEKDFNVPVHWVEDGSDNTYENAVFSFRILQQSGIKTIYLVSHAWHMPRAIAAFERAGFRVIPAPTGYTTNHSTSWLDFLPRASSLLKSYYATHEAIGLLWYNFKH